jgi:MFS transporter, CP family, cyanate transporter
MQQMSNVKKMTVFFAIFFVSLTLRPAVTSVGPLMNTIQDDLQITNTQISLLTAIPVFCMGLFAPLAVPFLKSFGYKHSINGLVILIGLSTSARVYFDSYVALLATSFLVGFAIAIISPIINAYIKETFEENMAPVIGIYSFAIGAGATLSAGLTGPIYEHTSNWSFALAIWGFVSIIALLFWTLAVSSKIEAKQIKRVDFVKRNPWKTKIAWIILLYFGLQTALFFSLTAWLPSIGQEQGYSLITAANVLTFMSIIQLIGNLTISSLISKFPNVITWLYSLISIGFIGAIIFMLNTSWSIWLGVLLLGIALSGLFPIGLLLPLQEAENHTEANEWSSMVLAGGFMMSAILPLFIGVLYDLTNSHVYTKSLFVLLFILMGITIVFYQRMSKRV